MSLAQDRTGRMLTLEPSVTASFIVCTLSKCMTTFTRAPLSRR